MRDACAAVAVLILGGLCLWYTGPDTNLCTSVLCGATAILVLLATSRPPRPPGATFQ